MNDPKGSIWRKWDLHIHTPASFHWNSGKHFAKMTEAEKNAALRNIVDVLNKSDVAAFGIMDYWTFDGYLEIVKFLRENVDVILSKSIFPGMELRIEAPVDYRLNTHVLLSNETTEQQLHDFKAVLKIRLAQTERSMSNEALIELAKTIDDSKAKIHGFGPVAKLAADELLQLGSSIAEITRSSLSAALKTLPEGSGLIILPYDTSDGLLKLDWKAHPHADNYFMQSAHIFESRSPESIDLFLGRETAANEKFIHNFQKTVGKPKPVISGSDAHRVADYGHFPNNCATWIKADTTFEGLKQILNEPEHRVLVGDEPDKEKTVKANRTKYIHGIKISKIDGAPLSEIWFNNEFELNHDLVAIIGNKGNGKSALADIIALAGNAKRQEAFSFLNSKKFLQPVENKGEHFDVALTWESGKVVQRRLDHEVDLNSVEAVKYIPQNFFEAICNELEGGEEGDFDAELKEVIFSHVKEADRLVCSSMNELMSLKTKETDASLLILKTELQRVNSEIIDLEIRLTDGYKQTVENLFSAKSGELESHRLSKPPEKPLPELVNPEVSEEINNLRQKQKDLLTATDAANTRRKDLALLLFSLDRVQQMIENFQTAFDTFRAECSHELNQVGINFEDIVSFTVGVDPITRKFESLSSERSEVEELLDPSKAESPVYVSEQVENQIAQLQAKLDEPNQEYQAYQDELHDWSEKQDEIIGDANALNSLKYYEKLLEDVKTTPLKLTAAHEARARIVKDIYAKKQKLAQTYSLLYEPVQKFIETHPLAKDKFALNFNVSIVNANFQDRFFAWISQSAGGSFWNQGDRVLKDLIEKYDFNNEPSVMAFLSEVMKLLTTNTRTGAEVQIAAQLRKGQTQQSLYDFVFSLDYLRPRYVLKMSDKDLHELSPGEKGALLLIFYLLVDHADIPLVIDQPEYNLDNHTIYDLLVPCIKEAKQRRQIVIVTHNPNLAVVCDAEQIICATLDKKNKNKVEYLTGSIENPRVNKQIVDILEGTRPAFDCRDRKYLPEKSDVGA